MNARCARCVWGFDVIVRCMLKIMLTTLDRRCVLFFIWHHVIGDFSSQRTFLLRWSEIYKSKRAASSEEVFPMSEIETATESENISTRHVDDIESINSKEEEEESWWIGRYCAQNLEETCSSTPANAIPSYPGDSAIVLSATRARWLNRCTMQRVNGLCISLPVSLPFCLPPGGYSCACSQGGDTCTFEFEKIASPHLTVHWQGVSTPAGATLTYVKQPPLRMGVFTLDEAAVSRLKAAFPPRTTPFLSTNDLLLAQFVVAVISTQIRMHTIIGY